VQFTFAVLKLLIVNSNACIRARTSQKSMNHCFKQAPSFNLVERSWLKEVNNRSSRSECK